jgi:hypothetical protein
MQTLESLISGTSFYEPGRAQSSLDPRVVIRSKLTRSLLNGFECRQKFVLGEDAIIVGIGRFEVGSDG